MVKKGMNGWRPRRNGCEFVVVLDEDCSLPTVIWNSAWSAGIDCEWMAGATCDEDT